MGAKGEKVPLTRGVAVHVSEIESCALPQSVSLVRAGAAAARDSSSLCLGLASDHVEALVVGRKSGVVSESSSGRLSLEFDDADDVDEKEDECDTGGLWERTGEGS